MQFELDQRWLEFESNLGEFKLEFSKARAELTKASHAFKNKFEDINYLKLIIENVTSPELKDRISTLIEEFEFSEDVADVSKRYSEAIGRVDAMKKVLLDTNVERYAKFMCFVCMDRLVDYFIEPCGHVICDGCWLRLSNHDMCPGCRGPCHGVKKIFSMT